MYDYRQDKNRKPESATGKNSSSEDVFDVDSIVKKGEGIKGDLPKTAEAWIKKLASEDEYIRNKK